VISDMRSALMEFGACADDRCGVAATRARSAKKVVEIRIVTIAHSLPSAATTDR
jgi:hypothetical protein